MKLNTREIALFGILGGLTFGAKVAMMWMPNIEPVSLMVMLFAVVLGRKALYPIYVYVLLELILYGLNLWSANYLYVWLILAIAAWFMRDMTAPLGWALLSGTFGLLFGLFCAPVYILTGGPLFALTWWINGIPFDIMHCLGNFSIALGLFIPLRGWLTRLYANIS